MFLNWAVRKMDGPSVCFWLLNGRAAYVIIKLFIAYMDKDRPKWRQIVMTSYMMYTDVGPIQGKIFINVTCDKYVPDTHRYISQLGRVWEHAPIGWYTIRGVSGTCHPVSAAVSDKLSAIIAQYSQTGPFCIMPGIYLSLHAGAVSAAARTVLTNCSCTLRGVGTMRCCCVVLTMDLNHL